ncbi:hypothetical protein YPPY96_3228, partial [Yersinia pestis PY-96]
MELDTIKTFFFVSHNGKRTGIRAGNRDKISRDLRNF